jgi:hypothetical protein
MFPKLLAGVLHNPLDSGTTMRFGDMRTNKRSSCKGKRHPPARTSTTHLLILAQVNHGAKERQPAAHVLATAFECGPLRTSAPLHSLFLASSASNMQPLQTLEGLGGSEWSEG